MAIIEQLSGSSAQMRSVNYFEIGATVEFAIVIHGASPIAAIGTVSIRTQNGARYTYKVSLDTTPSLSASVEHAVDVARARFSGAARPLPATAGTPATPSHASAVPPPPHGLTRLSVRIAVDFPVAFTINGSGSFAGKATNISTGGMLMNTPEQMPVGATLDLAFTLGSTPLTVKGRIVAHQDTSPNYNIAFFDVRDAVKQTLAEFVAERDR